MAEEREIRRKNVIKSWIRSAMARHHGSWRKTVAFTAPKLRRLPWIYVRGVYPRARTTRFIGAWPSFGRASWVNCKCFRQNFTKMASSTRGEFVYASWLPTWEKQHGARREFKPTNPLPVSQLFFLPVGHEISPTGFHFITNSFFLSLSPLFLCHATQTHLRSNVKMLFF